MQIISQKKRSKQQSADSSIRKIIYSLCKTDNQFNALLIDKFKHRQKDISESNSLEQKVNILLNIESKHVILDGLRDAIEDKLIFPGISDEEYSSICDEIDKIRRQPDFERQRHRASNLIVLIRRMIYHTLVALGLVWLTEKAILAWIWNKIRENAARNGGVVIILFGAGGGIAISLKSGCIEFIPAPPQASKGPVAPNSGRQLNICIRNLAIIPNYKNEPVHWNESVSNSARSPLVATLNLILNKYAPMSMSFQNSGMGDNQNFLYPGLRDNSKDAVIECTGSKDGRLPIDITFSFVREKQGTAENCNNSGSCQSSIHYLVSCKFAYKVIDPEHRYECPRPYDTGNSNNISDIMPPLPHSADAPPYNEIEEISSVFERCGGLFKVISQLGGCRQRQPPS